MPPKAQSRKAEEPFDGLSKWIESKHTGYKCRLVSKEIPGAGRGLFAAEDIPAGQTILEIPSSALLNPLTLASTPLIPEHLFPLSSKPPPAKKTKTTRSSLSSTSPRLNTAQLLTLYLALTRDPRARNASPWKSYLGTLPDSFHPWHPLTWYYKEGEDGWWQKLLRLMPVSTLRILDKVKERYEEDLKVLVAVLTEDEFYKKQSIYPESVNDDTLLWAWLNVNTRTVSVPLDLPGPSSLQNHTLVPVLDMINHSSRPESIIPKPIQFLSGGPGAPSRGQQPHLVPGKIGFRLIAPERGLVKDEEVKFEYGPHSTETLFTEYGFCPVEKKGDWVGEVYGECDVNDLVKEMFPIKSEKVKASLKELGCWEENKIYTHPKPTHASHGLIMTLRLFHLNKSKMKAKAENMENIRLGVDTYAEGCEHEVRASLIELCQRIWDDSGDHQSKCGYFISEGMKHRQPEDERLMIAAGKKKKGGGQWLLSREKEEDRVYLDTVESILPLWCERTAIARKLKTGIAAGQNIWD